MDVIKLNYQSAGGKDLESVQREMDYLFNMLCGRQPQLMVSRRSWRPPMDMFETEQAVVVKVELAGVREEDIHLTVEEGQLVLTGHRDNVHEGEKRVYHEMDVNYGEFRAEIFMPVPIDEEKAHASYHQGFLTIVLPKATAEKPKPKHVPITVANE
jgi:HSP20 family protein